MAPCTWLVISWTNSDVLVRGNFAFTLIFAHSPPAASEATRKDVSISNSTAKIWNANAAYEAITLLPSVVVDGASRACASIATATLDIRRCYEEPQPPTKNPSVLIIIKKEYKQKKKKDMSSLQQ